MTTAAVPAERTSCVPVPVRSGVLERRKFLGIRGATRHLDVASLSMRGAQREITGWLLKWGYKPDGRWTTEEEDDQVDYGPSETVRRFKLAA